MSLANPLRWAVLGVGRFGMIHARILADLPGVELSVLCTRSADRLSAAAAELGVSRTASDYRTLLDDPNIDAVSITTHWQQHHELALAALAAGKHVLLEKPLAANGQQCREIVEAASAAAVMLMVGHVCRFDPRVTLAQAAIAEGRIGRVISMHAKRNLPRAPGSLRLDKISPLMGDGVHDADLMLWFTGRTPSRVYGRNIRVDQFAYPDLGWAMLEFDEDAIGVVETVWRLPENTPTTIDAVIQVIGTEGQLRIDCGHAGLEILDSRGLKYPDTAYWPQQHGHLVGALREEISYFARCIRDGQEPTVITPQEAARAVMVMEAAEQSASTGQSVPFADPFSPIGG